MLSIQIVLVFMNFLGTKLEESDIQAHNLYRQILLLWGPSAFLGILAIALSYKNLIFVELFLPVQIISMCVMYVVLNMSDIIEEKNSQFR